MKNLFCMLCEIGMGGGYTGSMFALECDVVSLYTLWGELSQNQVTNASVLLLPGETLKTD